MESIPANQKTEFLNVLSNLYGCSEREGRNFVHIQHPAIRDHWNEPGKLALNVLGVDADTMWMVRLYWNIPDDGSPFNKSHPDHFEYA